MITKDFCIYKRIILRHDKSLRLAKIIRAGLIPPFDLPHVRVGKVGARRGRQRDPGRVVDRDRTRPEVVQGQEPPDPVQARHARGTLPAGGSGVVPLRCILRHRQRTGSRVPARLLYSARALPEVIYRDELDTYRDWAEVSYTLTRSQPPGWTGFSRRIDAALLTDVAWPAAGNPLAFMCGPTNFVETAAAALVGLGYPADRVKTERFGATGG
jgi:hypothetical protein